MVAPRHRLISSTQAPPTLLPQSERSVNCPNIQTLQYRRSDSQGQLLVRPQAPLPIAARASQQGTEICNTLTGLCRFSWPCGNGGNGSMRYVRRSQVGSGHFDRTYRTRTVNGNMDIHLACSACIDSVTRRQVSRPGYGQPHSLQG